MSINRIVEGQVIKALSDRNMAILIKKKLDEDCLVNEFLATKETFREGWKLERKFISCQ